MRTPYHRHVQAETEESSAPVAAFKDCPGYVASARPDGWRILVIDCALVVLLASSIVVVVFHLWSRSLRTPLDYDGDGLLNGAWIKVLIQNGWVDHNSRLGAPFGQTYYDFPLGGDDLHFLVLKVMSLFSRDWALLLNAFFYLTFPAVAVSAYLCQRWLGVRRVAAITSSVVFAFLPMHFIRGADHIFLSSYAVVPVAVLLSARGASGLFPWQPTAPAGRRRPWVRAVPWLLLVAMVGSSGAYYFFFAVVIVCLCGVIASLRAWNIRPALASIATACIGGFVFALNNVGSLLYWRAHGPNPQVASRSIEELDAYAMRVIEMVSPMPMDRIGFLRTIGQKLTTTAVTSETTQFLGLVGAIGLVLMLGAAVLSTVGRRRRTNGVLGLLPAVTLVLILISTAGGLAWLGNLFGFTQIRAWSRSSVVIGFMALTFLAVLTGELLERQFAGDRRRRSGALFLLSVIVAVAMFDQVPQPLLPHAGAGGSARYSSDKNYFASVEATLPSGAAVAELPYRRFPEEVPTYRSEDYDLLRPYLNTQTIRWSYGGMRGRESEWQLQLAAAPAPELLADLAAVGFDGVLVDRLGYADGAVALEDGLRAALDAPPVVDPSQRWAYFDIQAYRIAQIDTSGTAAIAARRDQLLYAPWLDRTGCWAPEPADATRTMTWCRNSGTLVVTSERYPRSTTFLASVVAPTGNATLTVFVEGRRQDFQVGPVERQIRIDLSLTKRITTIQFRTDATRVDAPLDPRALYFRLIEARLVPQ